MHYCIKVEAAVSIAQSDFLRMQETKKRFYIVTFSGHDWTRNVSSFFPTFESAASFYSPSFEVECWASCSSASLNVCDEKKTFFVCVVSIFALQIYSIMYECTGLFHADVFLL